MFITGHQRWALRHAVPLEEVLKQALLAQGLTLRWFEQLSPHPVYQLGVRLWRNGPKTKAGVEKAVVRAFGRMGKVVGRDDVRADISGDTARVTVLARDGE